MFLLGSAKLLAYHLHLLIPAGLQEGGAGSFISAWYQILSHYLLWFLWLSAHLDYAVALARLFGVAVPAQFHFPLLASSPRDFWRRWHVLHHLFLKEWVYQPCGGKQRPLRAIFCTFLVSSLLFSTLWIGSSRWLLSAGFLTRWLPFFMIQAFLVCLQFRLVPPSGAPSLFRRLAGWLFTQTGFALCCLFLAGSNRFPCDTVSAHTTLTVLRRAFFLE
jgi:D-alanyl-lipoteichoic acid acyltransferase DltB (MBOAT superfamily)